MTTTRAGTARRVFRFACYVWLLLVPAGQIVRLPYLRPPWGEASWELSLAALMAIWVGTAVWSGAVGLGYRGVGNRTVYRSEAPGTFWWNVGIGAFFGLALLGIGIVHLPHHP